MDYFILQYIKQNMRKRGIIKYHFEPYVFISITGNFPKLHLINANNEYFYLVSKQIANGCFIESENERFYSDNYNSLSFSAIREFTGQIKISVPPDLYPSQVFEFIRVIPE